MLHLYNPQTLFNLRQWKRHRAGSLVITLENILRLFNNTNTNLV